MEPPHKTTNMVQCTRCQQYNHTKAYCNLPYKCLKCGIPHDSKTCVKSRNTPAKCALCGGAHPANYRGCQVHKELQNKIRQKNTNKQDRNKVHSTTTTNTRTTANVQYSPAAKVMILRSSRQ